MFEVVPESWKKNFLTALISGRCPGALFIPGFCLDAFNPQLTKWQRERLQPSKFVTPGVTKAKIWQLWGVKFLKAAKLNVLE